MAQAQMRNPKAEAQKKLIDSLDAPLSITEPKQLVSHFFDNYNLMLLMLDPDKRQDASSQEVYQKAVDKYGNEAEAVAAIQGRMISVIKALDKKAVAGSLSSAEQFGGDADFKKLCTIFSALSDNAKDYSEYFVFNKVLTEMTNIEDAVSKGKAIQPDTALTKGAAAPDLVEFRFPEIPTRGSMVLLGKTSDAWTLGVNFKVTDPARSAFGGDVELAKGAAIAYANAILAYNKPGSDQGGAAVALAEALGKVPPGNSSIWGNESFKAALDFLKKGDLANGLNKLANVHQLDAIRAMAPNIYQFIKRADSYEVWQVSLETVIQLSPDQVAAWDRLLAEGGNEWAFKFLGLLTGVQVSGLKSLGYTPQFALDPATGNLVPTGTMSSISGGGWSKGWANAENVLIQVPIGLAFGVNIPELGPFKITAKGTCQWLKSSMEGTATTPLGAIDPLKAAAEKMELMAGFYGVEIEPLHHTGELPLGKYFWIERVRIGGMGDPRVGNAIFSVTTSATPLQKDDMGVKVFLSGDAINYSGTWKVGGQVLPQVAFRIANEQYGSAGVAFNFETFPQTSVIENGIWTLQVGLPLSYSPTKGFEISAMPGVLFEKGGLEMLRTEPTFTLRGGVKITMPEIWEGKSASETVPSRISLSDEVYTKVGEVRKFLDSDENMEGPKATKLAGELAASVRKSIGRKNLGKYQEDVAEGLSLLDAGDLSGGMRKLDKFPQIYNIL